MDILVFGDQTADQYSLLNNIVNRKNNAVLMTFLERVCVAIREEVAKLAPARRQQVPSFLRLTELVEAYYEQHLELPELESSLVTIAQLSHYIGYFEDNPGKLVPATNFRTVGLCTGLLAAAAVASARSLSELIPVAVECVRISFRVGAWAARVRDAVEPGAEIWSRVVTNTSEADARAALGEFHQKACIVPCSHAYVSAISVMAVTVSGPPSTLHEIFRDSAFFSTHHSFPIPVFAPYHASHLYSTADIAHIIDADSRRLLYQFVPQGAVHSASTGQGFAAKSTLELVELVLQDILIEPVRWDSVLHEVVARTRALEADCTVYSFGISNVANSLATALKSDGHQNLKTTESQAWIADDDYKGRTQADKIAIVGMSGRFPSAANHGALWDLLVKGLDVHKQVPKERFDPIAHTDATGKGKNKSHTPFGCFIDEPGLFDPRFFNMSPREAAQTDPMGRLALVTAYEALEMSGYVPNRTPSTMLHRIGTFYGQTSDDWREINAAENIDTYFITGGVRAFAPGRINYYFKFSGPSFSIDTACSSSLAAIQLACTSLWAGDCDTAVAGGLNVLTNPDIFAGLSKGQFLSKTGSCKTYDNDADGYCRGDGCASVILKRYEDAVTDKDMILGSILATGTNHSAEAVSITHPHAGAQEFLYKKILAQGGVDAHDVSYVEMHGTGTQAGDGIEMTSVTNTFAPPHRRRREDQPLYLGAIKANIGHGEASSGISALIKLLMMMRENVIPPNVGIKGVLNKAFPKDLRERNVNIPTQATPLPRDGAEKRLFFLNNFSAAGGNTAALLEDGPLRIQPLEVDTRSHHVLTVSGRAISSLKRNINSLIRYVETSPDTNLSSLAYTLTARRMQHNYRVAFTVSSAHELKSALELQIKDSYSPVPMTSTEVAFAFTGQGSQYTGLGQSFYNGIKSFREKIDFLNSLAIGQALPSIMPLFEGVEVTTLSPVVVQLGLACIQVALAELWASWGVKPATVIGHSLGEYAALHVAGVLSASHMIRLIGRRAELLVSSCQEFTHGMLAVKGTLQQVKEALGSSMTEVACTNGVEEIVLSGPLDAINTAGTILRSGGFKSTSLKVPYAFHSAQVEPMLEDFKAVAASVIFHKPEVPVMSPLTGQVIRDLGVIGPEYLARHARETVQFSAAILGGRDEQIFTDRTQWLEIGAHPVCSTMIRTLLDGVNTSASLKRGEDPWKTTTDSLAALYQAGVYIDFNEFHREFNDCQELLSLPAHCFDNKNYWLDYHNNWTLSKGEAPKSIVQPEQKPVKVASKLSTTSCQEIVQEELHANVGTVIFQTNLAEPKLARAVQGHQVNDNPLTPSSLYADQALTAAEYLYKQLRPQAPEIGLNVCKMEVPKPLIVKSPPPPEGEFLQIEATADLDANQATLKFRSVTAEGKKLIDHAHCIVKYEDLASWQENWSMTSFMVKTQIDLLRAKLATGEANKFLRGMAYRLFKNFVNYSEPYRGMESVICNASALEASATVSFQADEKDGNFKCAPFWIDSLCHISGFICNGTDLIDSENNVCISHGWASMRFAKPFSASKKYTNYIRMIPQANNVHAGDVYIFDGEELVGVVDGLKFQQIPRRLMNAMLPPPRSKTTTATAAASTMQPAAKNDSPLSADKQTLSGRAATKTSRPKPVVGPAGLVTAKVMKILAEETDVDVTELVDEAAFENLGVDSLLSLTIAAKLREELDCDIPSTLFTDNETVGSLKRFFAQFDGPTSPAAKTDSEEASSAESCFDLHGDSGHSTPASSAPSVVAHVSRHPSGTSEPSLARKIIAEEMGVAIDEIGDQADLAEMGMDSLMSLTILSMLKEHTGVDLPSEFLIANATIEDIENALGMRPKPRAKVKAPAAKPPLKPSPPSVLPTPQSAKIPLNRIPDEQTKLPQVDPTQYPKATSILLQGSPKTATRTLFLLPDGSGSATSYMNIPALGATTATVALNCPFMKTPQAWTDSGLGLRGLCALYITEIKRRQPSGPYLLGGWSAGGVGAYETACQLTAAGDVVERLLLIDAPSPAMAAEPLPPGLHLFFDELGILGSGGKGTAPAWLLDHFAAAIRALSEYAPAALPRETRPKTMAIWARRGIAGDPGDPQPKVRTVNGREPRPLTWLLQHRTDFGANGWDEVLGSDALACRDMPGDHFSMMAPALASELGRLMREGLDA